MPQASAGFYSQFTCRALLVVRDQEIADGMQMAFAVAFGAAAQRLLDGADSEGAPRARQVNWLPSSQHRANSESARDHTREGRSSQGGIY
jgi:hypothetical protein